MFLGQAIAKKLKKTTEKDCAELVMQKLKVHLESGVAATRHPIFQQPTWLRGGRRFKFHIV